MYCATLTVKLDLISLFKPLVIKQIILLCYINRATLMFYVCWHFPYLKFNFLAKWLDLNISAKQTKYIFFSQMAEINRFSHMSRIEHFYQSNQMHEKTLKTNDTCFVHINPRPLRIIKMTFS